MNTQNRSKAVALVTGASSGIGAVYAERLAARGYDLILVARREARLEGVAKRISAQYDLNIRSIVADLSNAEDLANIVQVIQQADALETIVNCAGTGALGLAQQVETQTVTNMLSVNITALTVLALAAAKRFSAQKFGKIINIGSVVAAMPVAGAGAYSGSKAYVLNFSKSLQAELKTVGVQVQVVMPGPIKTEFFGDTPAPFPEHLFMSAENLVDASLTAFDQGEVVTFPSLADLNVWQQYEQQRGVLIQHLNQTGEVAARYQSV